MECLTLHAAHVAGRRIEESFGRHRLSCKVGGYCGFGFEQFSNQRHRHDCHELCLVVSGRGVFLHDGTEYELRRGDVFVADPGVPHEIRAGVRDELVVLYLFADIGTNPRMRRTTAFGDQCLAGFLAGHRCRVSQENLLAWILFIEAYNEPPRHGGIGTSEALRCLVLEAFAALGTPVAQTGAARPDDLLEAALDYIDAHQHQPMRIGDNASHCGTSQRNLELRFRRQFGHTVLAHVNEKRMDLARHYLSLRFSVSETAAMVGMHDASRFSTLFRRLVGTSPMAYRKAHAAEPGMGRRV